jgi:hypothetical protein
MLTLKLRPAFEHDVFELSWSLEREQSMVDLVDVTDVACLVLSATPRHAGATYELVGPGRFTAHDIGAVIARVMGRPIEVREIDADTYLTRWIGDRDASEMTHQVRVMRAITARYSGFDFIGNPNVLTWLLGRPPTTFESYVKRQYDAYLAAAS